MTKKPLMLIMACLVLLSGCANNDTVEVIFQPMQCEQTLWMQWYEESPQQTPQSEEEIATQYYAQVAVELKSFEKVRRDQAVCEACHECPQDHYFIAKVAEDRWDVLREEGWVLRE
jgi:hypothetical protein